MTKIRVSGNCARSRSIFSIPRPHDARTQATPRSIEAELADGDLIYRYRNPDGFAEQIDAKSGEQRGNFPQAFTHISVINHAVRLEEGMRQAGLASDAAASH